MTDEHPIDRNPYAAPAGDGGLPAGAGGGRPAGSRGLRIAGAVALIFVSLWSGLGGGCTLAAGLWVGDARGSFSAERAPPRTQEQRQARELVQGLDQLAGRAGGLVASGAVILGAGLLCLVAGILFLLDRGRWLGLVAVAAGAVGEVLFFALVAFNAFGLVKLGVYGFCGFCALQVGGAREVGPPTVA